MKGFIYTIIDKVTGKAKFPKTVEDAITLNNGKTFSQTYVAKDGEGLTYLGERIFPNGHHFQMTELGKFREYPASGALQGGDVYGDIFYQFYDGGGVMTIDLATKTKIGYFVIPGITEVFDSFHFGAVSFSNEFENEGDTLPLVYATGGAIGNDWYVGVFNINGGAENAHLVRYFKCNNGVTDSICAFDFSTGHGWSFGYSYSTAYITHKQTPYRVLEFDFPQTGTGDISESIVFAEQAYLVPNLGNANVQDATYRDGRVYVLAGGHYNYYAPDGTDQVHIGSFCPLRKTFVSNVKAPTFELPNNGGNAPVGESESIGIWVESFIVGFIQNANKDISHYKFDF